MDTKTNHHRSILIIDDERPVREAITDILDIENIPVITAESGESGIQIYQDHQSDIELVILDLSMPGLSGAETLQKLQVINPNIKVILSSGYSDTDISDFITEQNNIGFLAKPYKIDSLLSKISEFMP